MNNKGWGLKEFIWLLCGLAFCLIVVIVLYYKLVGITQDKNHLNLSTEFKGTNEKSIKSYIDIEDKMVIAAKKYKIENVNDTVIIKLNKLIENGYISIIRDPNNKKECSGYIIYDGSKKEYKAYLSCSGNYQTSDYNANFE